MILYISQGNVSESGKCLFPYFAVEMAVVRHSMAGGCLGPLETFPTFTHISLTYIKSYPGPVLGEF